jgi:two-component system invasion response regulator UvrY
MRILLVDGHPIFLIGLRCALANAPDQNVIGEASTAKDALPIIAAQTPDLVLLELALPGMDAPSAIRAISRRAPTTRVVVMSAHDQVNDLLDVLEAGAASFALKSDSPETIVEALRTVARGQRYVAPAFASRLATFEARRRRATGVLAILSVRERQIFDLASQCVIARDIAHQLRIARKTVDTHINRIHRKLGLRNMADLVKLAASLGLLQSDRPLRSTPEQSSIEPIAARGQPERSHPPSTGRVRCRPTSHRDSGATGRISADLSLQ